MAAPLAVPDDLAPWGTFTEAQVRAASEAIRAEANWHIAPERTETLTVTIYDRRYGLNLPTLRVGVVTEVRDVTTATVYTFTSTDFTRVGTSLSRYYAWTPGTYEVDLTHGYAKCPGDLLPVIASRIQNGTVGAGVASVTMNLQGEYSESTTYRTASALATRDPAVRRYSLPLIA